jgi:ATP-dependent RNA helicase DeaD
VSDVPLDPAPDGPGFDTFALDPHLRAGLADLGFESPTPIQAAAIPALLSGRDVVGRARTGSGKTLAFGLPLLQRVAALGPGCRALVLAPTRELALQVAEALEGFAQRLGVGVVAIYGGAPYAPQLRALARGAKVVVGTPGRVLDHAERGSLVLDGVAALVLDEADEMLRMGFVDDVEKVLSLLPSGRQIALFSATMPDPIRRLASTWLRDPAEVQVEGRALTVEHIAQQHVVVPQAHKVDALVRLLGVLDGTAIVFARTRVGCAEVAGALADRGVDADAIHGDLGQAAREAVLGRLRSGRLRVLVATDVAARGLDVEHLELVVNLDLPTDPETYVHRIGRTGRAGRSGLAIALVTPHERKRLGTLERVVGARIPERPIPTDAEVARHRRAAVEQELASALATHREGAAVWLTELVEGHGWSVHDLALAALARVADDRRLELGESPSDAPPPWAPAPRRERPERGPTEAPGRPRAAPEEEVELFLPIGKRNGVRPQDLVGALANDLGIPGTAVGRITLFDRKAFVRLPRALGEPLVGTALRVRGQDVPMWRARPDSGPPPRKGAERGPGGEGGDGPPRRPFHKGPRGPRRGD